MEIEEADLRKGGMLFTLTIRVKQPIVYQIFILLSRLRCVSIGSRIVSAIDVIDAHATN